MTGRLLVLGATGGIGRGVVAAAVEAGRPVIAVARDAHALQALRARHATSDIVALPASVASDHDAGQLALRLREIDHPITGAIVALCGDSGRGRLLDQPADALRRRLDEDVLSHLFAARHLLPLLAGHGPRGYVLIGGPGAVHPWAGYGHRSIGAAALRMLARVLHDEARTYPVRVQLLAIDSPACTDDNVQHACPQWPSALSIGRQALALVEQPAAPARAPAVVAYRDPTPTAGDRAPSPPPPATRTPANPATHTAPAEAAPLAAFSDEDIRALLQSLALPSPQQETSPR